NANAFKLAQLIGVSPLEIIAAGEVSKNPEKANFWAKWGAVAGVIMAVIADQLFFNNQSVTADTLTALFIPYANYCIRYYQPMLVLLRLLQTRSSIHYQFCTPREHQCPLGSRNQLRAASALS